MSTIPKDIQDKIEEMYPLDDPRKNMHHDNMGQYSRREAFIAGYQLATDRREQEFAPENYFKTEPKMGERAGVILAILKKEKRIEELEKEKTELLLLSQKYAELITAALQSQCTEKEKECEELEDKLDSCQILYDACKSANQEYFKLIEELKAENFRLRKYLEEYDKDYAKKHGIV